MRKLVRLAILVGLFGSLALGIERASASTLVVDADGLGSASDCNDTTLAFSTIGAAVTVAIPGDTIKVCPATYTEQVTIGKSLTLQSTTPLAAVIQAPSSMANPKAIVRVSGLTTVAAIDGFTISGPGGTCDSIRYGVRVDGGASATIQNNHIASIRDNPFSGCQNGLGILVGRTLEATTGTATIQNNTIDDYQKGGIVVDNTGSNAVITGNTITGAGRTKTIAQNGIQISRGATAMITGNTVTHNFYDNSRAGSDPNCPEGNPSGAIGSCLTFATGILFFASGSPGDPGQLNRNNTLRFNQVNVVVIAP